MSVTILEGTSVLDIPRNGVLVLTFGDGDVVVTLKSSKVVTVNKNGVIKIKGMSPEHLNKYCATGGVSPMKGGGGGGSPEQYRTRELRAGNAETS